jgi:hypothetical protein
MSLSLDLFSGLLASLLAIFLTFADKKANKKKKKKLIVVFYRLLPHIEREDTIF